MKQRNTKLSHEEFLERMFNINPNIEILSEYIRRKSNIECRCLICGHEWSPKADKLMIGRGCPKCANKKRSLSQSRKHEDFMEDFLDRGDNNVEILSEYKNSYIKLQCRCKVCGNEWETLPHVLLYGHGCKKCSDERNKITSRKTHEEFLTDFSSLGNKNIEIVGRYINSNTKIECMCKICGRKYYSSPIHLLGGQGCIDCYIKSNRGENHPKWNKNKTDEERIKARGYLEYQDFVSGCLSRDNYTCQITGQVGGKLNVHHLNGYNWCKEKRVDLDNGITLSKEIHKEFHSIYGYGNNTNKQFIEFINKLYIDKRLTSFGYTLLISKIKNE